MGGERLPLYGKVSSSISNFKEKLHKKYPPGSWTDPTVFFGMYHGTDYLKFVAHRGPKAIFWCGSDIRSLQKYRWVLKDLGKFNGKHYCENGVEQLEIGRYGIDAEIHPMIFDATPKVSFLPSKNPHVFITSHKERKKEYGVDFIESIAMYVPNVTFHFYGIIRGYHELWTDNKGRIMNLDYVGLPNIVYHGKVSNEQFNEEIKGYQASIRLNEFDGFAESTAKSILMGQYPITRILYPHIDNFTDEASLISLLNMLQYKDKPNPYRDFWYEKLTQPLTV